MTYFVSEKTCKKIISHIKVMREENGMLELGFTNKYLDAQDTKDLLDVFRQARDNGGKFYTNIVTQPLFTMSQIELIHEHIVKDLVARYRKSN